MVRTIYPDASSVVDKMGGSGSVDTLIGLMGRLLTKVSQDVTPPATRQAWP